MVTVLVFLLVMILAIALAIGMWFVSTQRQLVVLDENCKNALSQIEVQLNSRWDALLQLARAATAGAKHEFESLVKTIEARRQAPATTAEAINEQQGELSQVMSRLMVLSERYPDLKALPLFEKTMNSINSYEENVRMSRMVYNDTATKLNRAVRQWPGSFVAGMLHFTERAYLTVDKEEKKDMPNLF